ARVEADGHDLEVFSRIEREHAEGAGEPVHDLGAQHRAVVICEHQHDRLRVEVVAQLDGVALLVSERHVERNELIDVLVEADLTQRCREWRPPRNGARANPSENWFAAWTPAADTAPGRLPADTAVQRGAPLGR